MVEHPELKKEQRWEGGWRAYDVIVIGNFHSDRNRLTAMTNGTRATVGFAPNNTVISTYAYTLDGVGNRTRVDLNEPMMPGYNAETINYTYSLGNILNTAAGGGSLANGTTYTHDVNGNRTSKTSGTNVTSYTYDSLNRLTQTSTASRQIQYIYNGLGQRVAKIDNGVRTNYLIDLNGLLPQVLAELDASNNLIAYYVYDGVGLVAKVTPQNQYYFYHYDGLGSTIAITDKDAQVVNKYCYSPEGLVGAQETIPNPFTYVGRFGVTAEGNGLYCMRARYYDPETGGVISKDLIGYTGGDINLYQYVANNPVNWVDPWGLYHCVQGAVCDFTPELDTALRCFDECTGRNTQITSGRDSHPEDDPHMRGEACDIGRNTNSDLTRPAAETCFAECFTRESYAQEEQNSGLGTHFHFQITPGVGRAHGFPGGVRPHGRRNR